jgi:N-acyl-D-amino-acid deacylase
VQPFDIVIAGGTLVDGTGAPGGPGALVVAEDRLGILHDAAAIAAAIKSARQVIDARNKIVAPGFIDLHSHSGLTLLSEPRHEPKVRQGITTEVIGVDGLGYAPFGDSADMAAFVEMNAGLDGHPPGGVADWDSVASYLERFDRKVSINVAFLVGNSPLRIAAVGWNDVPADARAVGKMMAMLREGMEAGAWGVSSGLDYPPGSYASTDELGALAN